MTLKTTALTDIHIALGARMMEFAGYNMPVSYKNITEEHIAVRQHCGLFDVSHMGEFIVKGKQALDLILHIGSNDASKLAIGDAQYSCLPNDDGGIVDDMLVYRLAEDQCSEGEQAFMLVVNASNIQKDWDWIQSKNVFDTTIIDISQKTGLLALQGPKAKALMAQLCDPAILDLKYYTFTKGTVAGIDNVLISATGYTGSGGYELYVAVEHLDVLWEAIMNVGVDYGIEPAGLGARDTLRLEMGFCLYGNDINDTTSPIEAGLGWITKLKRPNDFPSKNQFVIQREMGVTKKLVGFIADSKRVPRHGYQILDTNDIVIGEVTSGTMSPSLDIPIGMGYVTVDFAIPNTAIKIKVGSKTIDAKVQNLPFYKV